MTPQIGNTQSNAANQEFFSDKNPSQICAQFVHDADNLLDMLMERYALKNDAALSRALGVAPPVISKIRHGRLPIGPALLLRAMEMTDASLSELQNLLAHRRTQQSQQSQ